ncbi:restriction endonuclease subunit S [Stutzerimonas stutzeri]|uniref:restriction endonuclease subunit S n=2 Tax=Stutzerimonas stutzeri TaxID=316 RepID=UPI0024B7D0C6|nr:restriction endonuclease subunit S [Stutzerimonas stutzeri]MDI9738502.1 restriction endonuclease subunit S [Stutzerimonas stutzeri]
MTWPLVKLGDVAPAKPSKNAFSTNEEVWTLNLDQIEADTGKVLEKTMAPVSEVGTSTHGFDERHVLYSKLRPYLNKVVLPDGRGLATTELVPMLPDPLRLDRKYLAYYLRSRSFVDWVSSQVAGAKMPRVSMQLFWQHEIPLPPLPEQKRIAAILDKANAIRRKRQQAIQLADDFLRAVFLDMFGDPVTNPKGWEVRPLSELVSKLGDGLHGTPEYDESGDYYFINGNNLDSGSIVINERVKRVGDKEFKKHKKELTKNTMLVSINGTIGKVAFYQGEKVVLGKSVCYFNVIPERISSMYLYHLIGSHYFLRYTSGIETGSTIKNVSLKSMRELPVPVPSADLQGRFEVLVKRIESKKAKLFAGHNSAGALFDSLSQNAFSGQL